MEKKGVAFFSVASGEWRVASAESESPVASGKWRVTSAESETPVASGWWLVASDIFDPL